MNESIRPPEQPDAAFDRLRAADPAAGLEPDGVALDAAVRARLAEPADELAVARARRRPRTWLTVAAAAAGALVFSTAGYTLGNAGGDRSDSAGGVITLGQQGSGQADSGLRAPEAALGDDSARSSSSLIAPWYGGRIVFTASGLSDDAGSAQAWAYDPAPVFTADTANRVAAALGIQGEAVLADGAWTVGPNDGTGPSLQLQPDGMASVSFYDPGLDPYGCPTVQPQGGDGSSGSTGSAEPGVATEPGVVAEGSEPAVGPDDVEAMPLPEPPVTCTNTEIGSAPQGDAAIARARDLLGSLGLDAGAFEYEVQESGIPQASYVTAHQVVGGERTGAAWSVGLVGDGVQSLNGSLAPVASLGTYDVVSANAAVARLTDPRFGASYGGPLMYAMEERAGTDDAPSDLSGDTATAPDAATSEVAPAPERTLPPTAQPGEAFAWPVTEVTLTSARLGLTMYTEPDGTTVLLPAYQLSSDDGQTWSVVAVADAHLDFAPVG